MSVRLKTKLSLGLVFLFVVILLFGILGLFYINRLSDEGRLVLKNNHESLVYCNRMMQALEVLRTDKNALNTFQENLKKQQGNITDIRRSIIKIQELNEMAILRKNDQAQKTADGAKDVLTILFTILTLVAF